MNLDKNSSKETITTKINDQNKTVENNISITNDESNASINHDITSTTKSALGYLSKDIKLINEKEDINITTDENLIELKEDINISKSIENNNTIIEDEFINISRVIKEKEAIDNRVNYTVNNINVYREWKKPHVTFNWNVIFLSKENLLVFWEWEIIDREKLFKLNLKQFLKNNSYEESDNITIYREWIFIECKKTKYNYKDSKGKNVKIYFWDIISNKREDIEKNILDINSLEYSIWSVKINKITKKWDFLEINIDTRFSAKKWINIMYDNNSWNVFFSDGDNYVDKWDFFNEDIEFYRNFRKTFSYFKDNNMFDEPLNEKTLEDWKKEQLDWMLREQAIKALRRWKDTYHFNWLDYSLYKDWKLSIPQVCIDYPLDFYEKFHDSYFDEKWKHWDKLNFEKVLWWFFARRRVWTFINNLKENKNNINEYFSIHEINENQSISYSDWLNVEETIKKNISKQVNIWDLILIEWKLSDDRLHRHSVLVSRIQANWNIIVQENAALPVEETLLRVLSRGPKRRIKYIVKPTDFLRLKK